MVRPSSWLRQAEDAICQWLGEGTLGGSSLLGSEAASWFGWKEAKTVDLTTLW